MRTLRPIRGMLIGAGLLLIPAAAAAEAPTPAAARAAAATSGSAEGGGSEETDVLQMSRDLDSGIESDRKVAQRDVRQGLYDIARVRYQELAEVVRDDMIRLDQPVGFTDYSEARERQNLRAQQLDEAMAMLRLLNVQ